MDWQTVVDDVASAVDEVGADIVLEAPGEVAGPESDPVFGPVTQYTVKGLIRNRLVRDANGLVVGRRMFITVAAAVAPSPGWSVLVGSRWHRVQAVDPLSPGGTDLRYRLEVEA